MLLPLGGIHRALRVPVLLPLYHTISDEPQPHISPIYPVRNVQQFTSDIETLLAHYEPISQQQLRQHLRGEAPLRKPAFHLTLDDGLRSCAEVVAPILLRYGIPATFFLNPPMLDNRALMFRYKAALLAAKHSEVMRFSYGETPKLDELAANLGMDWLEFLQRERPYMTTAQVQTLANAGFSLGAHSDNHPLMSEMSVKEAVNEVISSWRWVAENFPEQQPAFAFPFTASGIGAEFWAALAAQMPGDWLTFGTAGLKRHFIQGHFERFPVEKTTQNLTHQLLKSYINWMIKIFLNKNYIKI